MQRNVLCGSGVLLVPTAPMGLLLLCVASAAACHVGSFSTSRLAPTNGPFIGLTFVRYMWPLRARCCTPLGASWLRTSAPCAVSLGVGRWIGGIIAKPPVALVAPALCALCERTARVAPAG